jgi:hypothetical protein
VVLAAARRGAQLDPLPALKEEQTWASSPFTEMVCGFETISAERQNNYDRNSRAG